MYFLSVTNKMHLLGILKKNEAHHLKVKVKAVCGSYSTDALRHIVLLPK